MLYLLATIGAVVIAILVWRAFDAGRVEVHSSQPPSRPVAPDDDPEFLQQLDEHNRRGESG
ncbi:MAG: hypothetical protein ACRDRN_22210 [Sciscionella sp.]